MVYSKLEPGKLRPIRLWDCVNIALGRSRLCQVQGCSMMPTLCEGDWVVYTRASSSNVMVGQLVVCRHPYRDQHIVKRVVQIGKDAGRVYLQGDNQTESTDSRSFGPVAFDRIVGVVIAFRAMRQH